MWRVVYLADEWRYDFHEWIPGRPKGSVFGRPHLCDKVEPVRASGPTSHALQMAALLPPAVLASGLRLSTSSCLQLLLRDDTQARDFHAPVPHCTGCTMHHGLFPARRSSADPGTGSRGATILLCAGC